MKIKAWYVKHRTISVKNSRDYFAGFRIPTKSDFLKHYKMLPLDFSADESNERIFIRLNKDDNPMGTPAMQMWIRNNKVAHTSMSVGDAVQRGDAVWIVKPTGFKKMMWTLKSKSNVSKTIDTAMGTAHFVKTEIEDEYGHWNDNYYTRDGYWVIHEGNKHHVYKVKS